MAQSPYADAPDAVSRSSPISRVLKRDTCGRNTRGPLRPLRAHVAHVAPERGGRSRPTSLEAWHNVARPSLRRPFEKHWGDSGGTPADKDGEIRARMGKSRFQPWVGRGAATGVFGRGCVETKGFELAPQVGLEPTTLRLTAECSTIELLRSSGVLSLKQTPGQGVKSHAPACAASNHFVEQLGTRARDHYLVHQQALLAHHLRGGVHCALDRRHVASQGHEGLPA